jgi:hypothetical protein
MIKFAKYTIVWISQNLSIPFWMVGHVHLMTNVYQDIQEVLMSFGMNLIVAAGFIIDYREQHKNNKNGKKSKRTQKKSSGEKSKNPSRTEKNA